MCICLTAYLVRTILSGTVLPVFLGLFCLGLFCLGIFCNLGLFCLGLFFLGLFCPDTGPRLSYLIYVCHHHPPSTIFLPFYADIFRGQGEGALYDHQIPWIYEHFFHQLPKRSLIDFSQHGLKASLVSLYIFVLCCFCDCLN